MQTNGFPDDSDDQYENEFDDEKSALKINPGHKYSNLQSSNVKDEEKHDNVSINNNGIPDDANYDNQQLQKYPHQQQHKFDDEKLSNVDWERPGLEGIDEQKQHNSNTIHISKLISREFKSGRKNDNDEFILKDYYAKQSGEIYYVGHLYHIKIQNNPNCPMGLFMPCKIPDYCLPQIRFPVCFVVHQKILQRFNLVTQQS